MWRRSRGWLCEWRRRSSGFGIRRPSSTVSVASSPNEAEHNLLFGILDSLRRPPGSHPEPYLAAVVDGDRVVAAAWTPPRNLVLSEADDPAAIGPSSTTWSSAVTTCNAGPPAVAWAAAERWTAATERPHRLARGSDLPAVPRDPYPGPSRARCASRARPIEPSSRGARPSTTRRSRPRSTRRRPVPLIDARLALGTKRLYLWEVEGRAVSWSGWAAGRRMGRAGRAGLHATGGTRPRLRERARRRSVAGRAGQWPRQAFLFTDLANPTANRIYQAIGYEPVSDVDAYYFD